MNCSIRLKYDDGKREDVHSTHGDLSEVTEVALRLADDIGKHPRAHGYSRPKWVEIYCDGVMFIGISILSGGLLAPQDELLSSPK